MLTCMVLCGLMFSLLLGINPSVELVSDPVTSMFNPLRNYQAVFHRASFHFDGNIMRDPETEPPS